jgi:hypothetical protein
MASMRRHWTMETAWLANVNFFESIMVQNMPSDTCIVLVQTMLAAGASCEVGTPEKRFASLGQTQQRTRGEGRLKSRLCSSQQFSCLNSADVPERHQEQSKA